MLHPTSNFRRTFSGALMKTVKAMLPGREGALRTEAPAWSFTIFSRDGFTASEA